MFSTFIQQALGFTPTHADPDVYIRKQFKADNSPYYEFMLVYVDDCLVVSHKPEEVMKAIGKEFEIKNDEYGPPEYYLGAGVEKFRTDNGATCWSMKSDKYVKNAVQTVEDLLAEDGRELKGGKRNHANCLPVDYKPELDTTRECDEEHASRFAKLLAFSDGQSS